MNMAAVATRCRVERTVAGVMLYLRFGYWVKEQSRAQVFDDRDAAENARYLKRQGGRIVPA